MTKSGIVLSVFAVILAGVYVWFFTDWFHTPTLQIIPTIRPVRPSSIPRDPDQPPVYPVSFSLDGKYRFTEIKVVNAAEFATNKYANPLWHMISDSNSVPTKSFLYGQPIRGMKASVPRARPQPLEPNTAYTLLVATVDLKAQTNFRTAIAPVPPR